MRVGVVLQTDNFEPGFTVTGYLLVHDHHFRHGGGAILARVAVPLGIAILAAGPVRGFPRCRGGGGKRRLPLMAAVEVMRPPVLDHAPECVAYGFLLLAA